MHYDYYHTLSYESFTFSAFISLVIMFHRLPDDSYRYTCKFHKGTGTHYLCYNTPPPFNQAFTSGNYHQSDTTASNQNSSHS